MVPPRRNSRWLYTTALAMMFDRFTNRHGAAALSALVNKMQNASWAGSIQTIVPDAPV
jgi:hypothetical protein